MPATLVPRPVHERTASFQFDVPMVEISCRAIVMDIEGTTSAARFVYDVLFPYAREHMAEWVTEHRDDPATAAAVAEVAADLGVPAADTEAVVSQLVRWIDEDVKAAPLKTIQGLIWAQGYARGDLTSHVFDDVVPALEAWRGEGLTLAIYSSGSVAAQRSLFAHSPHGDLNGLIAANFDITTAGPKREAESYRRIAEAMAVDPTELLFLSDIQAELDAAREAGWQVVGLLREGEAQATASRDPHVGTFADILISAG